MKRVRVTLAALLTLCLGACAGPQVIGLTGPQLISVNSDLTRLIQDYDTIKRNAAKGDKDFARFVAADGELESLTDSALAQARDSSDAKAKISYYRIAATAGWQRLDDRVLTITSEGSKVCNDNNGFELSPRDCVMLLVIPDLVVSDAWSRKIAQIQSEAGPPGLPAKYRVVAMDLVESYNGLARGEARARASRAPPALASMIAKQRATVKRNLARLIKLFNDESAKGADDAEILSICNEIRARAADAVPPACATFR
jgi:hypothetical protein